MKTALLTLAALFTLTAGTAHAQVPWYAGEGTYHTYHATPYGTILHNEKWIATRRFRANYDIFSNQVRMPSRYNSWGQMHLGPGYYPQPVDRSLMVSPLFYQQMNTAIFLAR